MRAVLLLLLLSSSGCAAHARWEVGQASWYGPGYQGRPTASGEVFRQGRRTAAHRTLPFGTVLLVERVDTGAQVRVVVNDRGPFVAGRIVDLARGAARRLGMIEAGVVPVRARVVGCKRSYDGPRGCATSR